MKKILVVSLLLLLSFTAFLLIRTLTLSPVPRKNIEPARLDKPREEALQNFSAAIRFKTISFSDSTQFDPKEFLKFQEFLEQTYPAVHSKLQREVVAGYTLLYHWPGTTPGLDPVVLMAHQDVVPIEEATRAIWTVDPFGGVVKDGFVWGRGATDDKINLIAIMEAVEKLLGQNFQPRRSLYLVFGHDEEVGGRGAQAVVKLFRERKIRPELVLDEGGMVTSEKVPGLSKTVALLGTSEKGVLTLELQVEKGGGHAAMPENETAISILAHALTRLNETRFESRFSPSAQDFMKSIGPEMPFGQRIAFANLWLFEPLVHSIYEKSSAGNAMIRTTMVPTIFHSGVKENVVPTVASATLNLRLLPGDSLESVQRKIQDIIDDDRVHIKVRGYNPATSVTSMDSFAYQTVEEAVRKTYDSIITTPFLMIAATDSRYFDGVAKGVIKFSPMMDPIGFHGIDERVSVKSFDRSIGFFEQLITGL